MTLSRFFLTPQAFHENSLEIMGEPAEQMLRVLRMRIDDTFIALDNTGMEYVCKIAYIRSGVVTATMTARQKNLTEPSLKLTLYQALPKKMELFELVLQKGTELGVSAFVPLITERTERTEITKLDRLRKIILEAAEQSERGKLPTLSDPVTFSHLFVGASNAPSSPAERGSGASPSRSLCSLREEIPQGINVILHARADAPHLKKLLTDNPSWDTVNLFVGPEGGFTQEEVMVSHRKGFHIASLGRRILRTETAGIVGSSVVIFASE